MGESPRLGLALGGGAARGLAHIGVLNVLVEARVPIHAIAGTSMGAIVGGLHATGGLGHFEQVLRGLSPGRFWSLMDPTISRSGLFSGTKFMDLLRSLVGETRVENLAPDFVAVATDAETGEEVRIAGGDLVEALRASFAVPGLFTPSRCSDRWLVDGGVAAPVPVAAVRAIGVDAVLAVNLNTRRFPIVRRAESAPGPAGEPSREVGLAAQILADERVPEAVRRFVRETIESRANGTQGSRKRRRDWFLGSSGTRPPGLAHIVAGSLNTLQTELARLQLERERPDVLLEPPMAGVGLFDYDRVDEVIEEGARAARSALPKLRALLEPT